MGRVIDFLTVSVGNDVASLLRASTTLQEPGYGRPGFGASERRESMGGACWRRYEPRQSSKRWGLDYESWEWAGGGSDWAARFLAGRDARPSRVDIAWDFTVRDHVTADTIADDVAPVAERMGISAGISGQGGVHTRYFGAADSDRRIRIYRRDKRDPALLPQFGPLLRIEHVMKGDQAAAWWGLWSVDQSRAFAAAAQSVYLMTSLRVQDEFAELPALAESMAGDPAQEVFQFLKQHASTLTAWDQAGVPIVELAREFSVEMSSRTRYRSAARVRAIKAAGLECVLSLVRAMKGAKRASA